MRTVVATWILILLMFAPAQGQNQPTPEQLEKSYQDKLEKEFLKKAEWKTTFAEAKVAATEQNLPILVYFTRSYAP